jgi:hypothetical protein
MDMKYERWGKRIDRMEEENLETREGGRNGRRAKIFMVYV